jgi:predicted aconitase
MLATFVPCRPFLLAGAEVYREGCMMDSRLRLSEEEQAMLAGEFGSARQWAIQHQIAVANFFDAADLVPIGQAHIMADTEATGEAGITFVEQIAQLPESDRRVRVPTITDPRGVDFEAYKRLKQSDAMADIEARLIRALESLGVMMTNTCINYQTIMPPVRGEHLAFGDTGVVIYSNAVLGARSNFEGGPSALSAALTGRTPRYGYHLGQHRVGTKHFVVSAELLSLSDWGALGGIIGRSLNSYWEVPVISGIERVPNSDELKHFGAALASFGTVAMFHIPGITPEAPTISEAFAGRTAPPPSSISDEDMRTFYEGYAAKGDKVDVVVFSAPQLSLLEMEKLAGLLDGFSVHPETTLLAVTSPEIKFAADRIGLTRRIESSGALVLSGVCFYQSYAREMAEANGWKRLMSNSAKLVNIIGGYGYSPTLGTMEHCVESAIAGRIV